MVHQRAGQVQAGSAGGRKRPCAGGRQAQVGEVCRNAVAGRLSQKTRERQQQVAAEKKMQ